MGLVATPGVGCAVPLRAYFYLCYDVIGAAGAVHQGKVWA